MLRNERDETLDKLKTLEQVHKLKDEEIEELKKKIEGLEDMNQASKAEIVVLQKSKDEIEIKNKKLIKYEFEPLKKNHQNALNEISKLANFIRIYGTYIHFNSCVRFAPYKLYDITFAPAFSDKPL